MKLGLIGLANSGKTTIFNALSKLNCEVTDYPTVDAETNLAIIDVLDERIDKLNEMYNPKKTIYATIELMDCNLIQSKTENEKTFNSKALNTVRTSDSLAVVIKNFNTDFSSEITPVEDLNSFMEELILSDLIIAENRLEKIALDIKRGKKTNILTAEQNVIKKFIKQLDNNKLLNELTLEEQEEKLIRGFQFLTLKPIIVILNSSEDNFNNSENILKEINKNYECIEFCGKYEMEINDLDEEESMEFMKALGIVKSAKNRLSQAFYNYLGLISFFTVGKDEVRAWTIKKGANAVIAAGTIHSDLARGFIRAECFTYDDLLLYGSEKNLKEKGLFRLEGKTYIVKDGDILNIRFNV